MSLKTSRDTINYDIISSITSHCMDFLLSIPVNVLNPVCELMVTVTLTTNKTDLVTRHSRSLSCGEVCEPIRCVDTLTLMNTWTWNSLGSVNNAIQPFCIYTVISVSLCYALSPLWCYLLFWFTPVVPNPKVAGFSEVARGSWKIVINNKGFEEWEWRWRGVGRMGVEWRWGGVGGLFAIVDPFPLNLF